MGSSSSRLGPRHSRRPPTRQKSLSSLLLCAGSCSHSPPVEMEDDRSVVVHYPRDSEPVFSKLQNVNPKEPTRNTEPKFSIPKITTTASPDSDVITTGNSLPEASLTNVETGNHWKHFCESKELHSSPSHHSGDRASTSYKDQPMEACYVDAQYRISPFSEDSIGLFSDMASVENHASDSTSIQVSESSSASVVSSNSLRDNNNLLEGIQINNNNDSNRESRRDSRRLFWDAFSRRTSRRLTDSRIFGTLTDDSDDSGPINDRWVLDVNDNGFGNTATNERMQHSRSEMWERLRGGNGFDLPTNECSCGDTNACTCESVSLSEEAAAFASISRIVMLAEALFQVLDEIHRQPVTLSLVSLPAPESVVDSLLIKIHSASTKSGYDAVDQCLICLAEYEEEDKIRVLPCCHEFHMSCVDKWLKEIHGVCPLCRRDVREGSTPSSFSNSESP